MKQVISMVLLAAVPMIFSTDALAKKKGMRGHGDGSHLVKKLGITDEGTKKKIMEIKTRTKTQMKDLRSKRMDARKRMSTAMASGSDSDLRSIHEEIQKVNAEIGRTRFESTLAIRALLNDDQKKKFAKMKNRHMKRKHRGKKMRNRKGASVEDDMVDAEMGLDEDM